VNTRGQGGLRSRRKGKRGERELVALARQLGLEAERTWQTAQAADPAARQCDVRIAGRAAQVKVAARGFKRLYEALDGVALAFLRQDRREWLALLPATELFAMLRTHSGKGVVREVNP
jgi:alpha-D-ribose 1-methylphosphonate 5-triphosphate synthase subunit PhnH